MARIRILWADDEKSYLSRYEEELIAQGFEVEFVDDIDRAVHDLHDPERHFDLVIWDMAMPPGKTFQERSYEIAGGMTTGRLFQELVKKEFPKMRTLLFTNFREIVPDWNAPEKGEYALAKRNYAPEQFAQMVKRIVN